MSQLAPKSLILKDTSGVAQKSSKASDALIPGKSHMAKTLFVSDSNISGSVLPTPPSPSHNTFTIPNPIPQPPPINITILEPVTKTPIVSENQLQQRQHKPHIGHP